MRFIATYFFLYIVVIIGASSCKKDDPVSNIENEVEYSPNTAPCNVQEYLNEVSQFSQGGSPFFPNAQSHVYFSDIQFAFNHANPPTGMYTLCHKDNEIADSVIENQIMFARSNGSFMHLSTLSHDSQGLISSPVYVENNESELIISFCQFADTSIFFDINTNTYIGNNIKNSLYRNCY